MITEDYKRISMDKTKLDKLKTVFPSFFRAEDPEPIQIQIKKELFYPVLKSMNQTQIDTNRNNFQEMKQAPTVEDVQLQYRAVDASGTERLYAFSTNMPTPKDAVGVEYEFNYSSGNVKQIGNTTFLQPRQDDEYLYFLYFYATIFTNNDESVKKVGNERYSFFIPEMAQAQEKKTRLRDAQIITELGTFSSDDISRILAGLFQPVSKIEDTNFNCLFEYVKNGSEDQLALYESIKASVKEPALKLNSLTGGDDPNTPHLTVTEWIQKWITEGKIELVEETNEYFAKKGWYQKPPKDDVNAEDRLLKTPLPVKYVEGDPDQRMVLAEHLSNNIEFFNKLKKRW